MSAGGEGRLPPRTLAALELAPGSPVVAFLRDPREKVWGFLLSLGPEGVALRGIELSAFDEWMRQESRGEERVLGLLTLFYPMHRLERLERDETTGPVLGFAERFRLEVGRPVQDVL